MSIARIGIILLVPFLMAPGTPHNRGKVKLVGIVEVAGPSVCQQETHLLRDPCTGEAVRLVSSRVNLDLFIGMHVKVSGPGVGVTCDVIAVRSILPVAQKCAGPEP